MPMSSNKRPHGSIGKSNHGNHGSFGGSGSKGASSSKITRAHLKDAKADFKSPSKSYTSHKEIKQHEKATKSQAKTLSA